MYHRLWIYAFCAVSLSAWSAPRLLGEFITSDFVFAAGVAACPPPTVIYGFRVEGAEGVTVTLPVDGAPKTIEFDASIPEVATVADRLSNRSDEQILMS